MHRLEYHFNEEAYELLVDLSIGDRPWAIPWPCCYECLSVVANRKIWKAAASTPEEVWQQLRAWEASPFCRMIGETDGCMDILSQFVKRPNITGGIVHDARIAAIRVAHGVEARPRRRRVVRRRGPRIAAIRVAHGVEALLTRDRDFSMLSQLSTRDPLSVTR